MLVVIFVILRFESLLEKGKKIMKNSIKVSGWGQHGTIFSLIFYSLKNHDTYLKSVSIKLIFSNFGGGEPP